MGEPIYNFARTYNSYNSIFERVSKTSDNIYGEDCGNFKLKYPQSGDSLFINCQKSLFYINEIENVHGRYDSKKIEEGLVFIYYWLHENEFNNNNYKEDIKDIFKELLDLHDKYDGYASNVPDTFQYKIRNNLDDKLKDLYCLYDKLKKFKTGNGCENSDKCKCAEKCVDIFKKNNVECKSDNNKDFCKELHRFAQQFDDYITKNNTCDIEKVHVLLNKNPHISVILLPIVITLTITFFLLYKFTPFGSLICCRKKNKRKPWNNVYGGMYDVTHSPEMSKEKLKKYPYTLGYHSVDHPL